MPKKLRVEVLENVYEDGVRRYAQGAVVELDEESAGFLERRGWGKVTGEVEEAPPEADADGEGKKGKKKGKGD